jgi:hypothetical protein
MATALVAVGVGILLLPAAHASAQASPAVRPPLSLTTSPLPLNVTTKPGQPVTADIRVKNNGNQEEVLKVELLKFGAAGDTGRPQIMERNPQDQYFNWVTFSETTFTSEPNVWKTIHMNIKPPKEAAFGYYYAVLFSRANPDKPTAGNSAVEGGVASLVLLNVDAPGARRDAQIQQLVASQKVYEFLPAKFTVRLKNGGNVHVAPTGTMFIKRGSAQVAAVDFNSEQGNILPGTDRVFDMNWEDGFPAYKDVKDASGKTTKKLVWDFSKLQKLRFGRYTANLVAVYDDGQHDVPIEAVVSFWVIPWRILGVIFLIILFVFFGLWGIGRLIWRGIRRNIPTPVVVRKGTDTAALPVVEEEVPDPSSLAAATRSKRGRKKKEAIVEEPAPSETVEPAEVPEKPKRGRPKKIQQESVATETPAVTENRPKTAGRKPASPKIAKKPAAKLATKPARIATKPAANRTNKKKAS